MCVQCIYIYTHGGGGSECILATTSLLHALASWHMQPQLFPSNVKRPMQPRPPAALKIYIRSVDNKYAHQPFSHPILENCEQPISATPIPCASKDARRSRSQDGRHPHAPAPYRRRRRARRWPGRSNVPADTSFCSTRPFPIAAAS